MSLADDIRSHAEAEATQAEALEAANADLTSALAESEAEVARLTAALAECEGGTLTPTPPTLMVSTSPDRSNPKALSTAGSFAGPVFIFAESETGPVEFYVDAVLSRSEATAPYDLAGTAASGAANPFDTKTLSDGGHEIRAVAPAGTESVPVAVKNATTPPPEPPPTGDPFNPSWLTEVGPRANAIPNVPASAIRCTTVAQVAAAPAAASLEIVGTFNDVTMPIKGGQKVWGRQMRLVGADNAKLAFPRDAKGYTVYGGDISGYHGISRKGDTSDARRRGLHLDNSKLIGVHVHHMIRGGVAMLNGASISDGKHDHNPSFDFSGCNDGYVGYCDLGEGSGGGGVHPDGSHASDEGICKTAQAQGMVYEYNHGHDVKAGNGLWSDINNRGHRWYRNLLEDIPGIGIDLEISCDGEILEDVCRRVGKKSTAYPTWPTKSSIDVSNSPDATVIGNAIEDTDIGFATFNSDGHEGWTNARQRDCCLGVRNLLVQRNTLRNIRLWVFGITGSIPPESERHPDERCGQKQITDPASNNRFVDNDYPATGQFNYKGATVSRSSWESHGYS